MRLAHRDSYGAARVRSLQGRLVPVLFSGLAPGFAGVWQINALIPQDAPVDPKVTWDNLQLVLRQFRQLFIQMRQRSPQSLLMAWMASFAQVLQDPFPGKQQSAFRAQLCDLLRSQAFPPARPTLSFGRFDLGFDPLTLPASGHTSL